ncbi:hypothetical protein QTP70_031166, partial [Hemibagrus guttatus]
WLKVFAVKPGVVGIRGVKSRLYLCMNNEGIAQGMLRRSWLTEREHQRRAQMRLCYYCGASGHLIHQCPKRPSSAQVALIDSRAAVNLIDGALVEELRIPTIPCIPFLRITAIDSQPIGGGYLTRQTELLDFQVGLFHLERLDFYVTSSPANPVILGFPWLRQHDPQIS